MKGQNNLAKRVATLTINFWQKIIHEKEKKGTLRLIVTQV